jgi:hypothetical protein
MRKVLWFAVECMSNHMVILKLQVVELIFQISLFHRAFRFTIYNGPTNALVCNKTLIQMSHIKTLKITPTCFDHQLIILREIILS